MFDEGCKMLTQSKWKDDDDECYEHLLCIIQGGAGVAVHPHNVFS